MPQTSIIAGGGDSYDHGNILDNSNSCETWNTDFWRRHSPGNYKDCLDNKQRLKNLYSQGRCEKIVVKSFSYGGRDCVFEIIESQKRIVSSMCRATGVNAANSDEVEKIFKQKYGY